MTYVHRQQMSLYPPPHSPKYPTNAHLSHTYRQQLSLLSPFTAQSNILQQSANTKLPNSQPHLHAITHSGELPPEYKQYAPPPTADDNQQPGDANEVEGQNFPQQTAAITLQTDNTADAAEDKNPVQPGQAEDNQQPDDANEVEGENFPQQTSAIIQQTDNTADAAEDKNPDQPGQGNLSSPPVNRQQC